jgi:hypothetical protein
VRATGISDAVHVQCGNAATCVLRAGGKVSCFGDGTAIGSGGVADPQLSPFDTIPSGAADLAGGAAQGCAIMADASVKCWCGNPSLDGGVRWMRALGGVAHVVKNRALGFICRFACRVWFA